MFFIVEFRIYRDAQPEQRRLFRPNVPAVAGTSRWVHCKVPHRDPESLVRARPDTLVAAGLRIPTRLGSWTFDGELGVWIFRASAQTEGEVANLPLGPWAKGRYQGEPVQTYRSDPPHPPQGES